MTHLTLILANYLQNPIYEILGLMSRGFDRLQEYRRANRSIKELNALSDHQLKDMGISRGEIYSVVWAQKSLIRSAGYEAEVNENLKGFV